jgi:hypothetical protein
VLYSTPTLQGVGGKGCFPGGQEGDEKGDRRHGCRVDPTAVELSMLEPGVVLTAEVVDLGSEWGSQRAGMEAAHRAYEALDSWKKRRQLVTGVAAGCGRPEPPSSPCLDSLCRYQRVPAAAHTLCLPVPQPPGQLPLPVPTGPDPPSGRQGLQPTGAEWTKRDHCQPPGPPCAMAGTPGPHPWQLLPHLGLPPAESRSPKQHGPGLVPSWLHQAEWCLHG